MPQLELADFPSQIFWLIVSFSFLYLILAKITLPSVSNVLKDRHQRIANDLEKAEALKKQAEEAEQDFTSALVEAREKASVMIEAARQKTAKEEAVQFAKLETVFEKQSKEAEDRIKSVIGSVKDVILPVATDVSAVIVKKLINVDVDKKKAESFAKELAEKS